MSCITICLMNKLFKYADDTYLVVPASKSDTIESELQSIASWSESNNLTLNTKKSTEIVIYKPKSKNANLPPPPVPGIQRVSQMVVLGVTIQDRLSFKPHFENLISRCAQTFYALRVLKSQGLNGIALWDVGQAILINRLLYASPVWWGFTDASDKQRLQAVLTRAQRLGFLSPSTPPLSELCRQADDTLFSAIVCNQHHVLHGLLPPIKSTGHDLRTRSHDRALLPDDPLSRQNFINRMLTNNYYCAKL